MGTINSADFLAPVFEAIRNAMVTRDEDNTNDFIQRLVIRFFIAYDRSQNETENADLKIAWEFMTRILARRLVLLQPRVRKNYFSIVFS